MIDQITAVIGQVITGVVLAFLMARVALIMLKRQTKIEVVRNTLEQLGYKNFKAADLNADKLDDKGFIRLIQVLQVLKPVSANKEMDALEAIRSLSGLVRPSAPQWSPPPEEPKK